MLASSFIDPHGENGATWGTHTPKFPQLTLMVLSAAALVFRRRAPRSILATTGAFSA